MVQEVDIDVDLTAIFSLKKNSSCSSDLNSLNTFENINITEALKHFRKSEYKSRLKYIKSDLL